MTLASLNDYTKRYGAAADPGRVQQLLVDASGLVTDTAQVELVPVEDDEIVLDGDGTRILFLPDPPVSDLTAVVVDGSTLTDGVDYRWFRHGKLERLRDCWPNAPRAVTVTYDHGRSAPAWVVQLVCAMVQRSLQPAALQQVQQRTTGSQSVAYVTSSAGVSLWLTRAEADRIHAIGGPVFT